MKVVLTFEFVDNILRCDHSNESYWAVPSCSVVYYSEQAKFLTFHFLTSVDEILKCDFNWKLLSRTFLLYVYYAVHGGSSLWTGVKNLIMQSQTVDHYMKIY